MTSPVNPASFARLNAADAEIARRKQEVLSGVMAALAAHKEGKVHPRLLTKERKEALYIAEIERREHLDMAKRPVMPKPFTTRPPEYEEWGDFMDARFGRGGAQRQE